MHRDVRERWDLERKRDIADFIGCYLSEPKPHLYFDSPTTPLNRIRFTRSLQTHDIALALQSLMLCHDNTVFINGTAYEVEKNVYRTLLSLADKRQLEAASSPPQEAIDVLYQWYLSGYIVLV